MSALLASAALGLWLGVLFSIPPGPAGVIILRLSLRGARAAALRALLAFLAADVLVMLIGVLGVGSIAPWLLPWLQAGAGLFLLLFAASAWRALGGGRGPAPDATAGATEPPGTGLAATSAAAVFRITLLNPAIWIGAASMLALAPVERGLAVRLSLVAGLELGSLCWFLAVIAAAPRVPPPWRRRLEQAAVLVIGLSGAGFLLLSCYRALGARV